MCTVHIKLKFTVSRGGLRDCLLRGLFHTQQDLPDGWPARCRHSLHNSLLSNLEKLPRNYADCCTAEMNIGNEWWAAVSVNSEHDGHALALSQERTQWARREREKIRGCITPTRHFFFILLATIILSMYHFFTARINLHKQQTNDLI